MTNFPLVGQRRKVLSVGKHEEIFNCLSLVSNSSENIASVSIRTHNKGQIQYIMVHQNNSEQFHLISLLHRVSVKDRVSVQFFMWNLVF